MYLSDSQQQISHTMNLRDRKWVACLLPGYGSTQVIASYVGKRIINSWGRGVGGHPRPRPLQLPASCCWECWSTSLGSWETALFSCLILWPYLNQPCVAGRDTASRMGRRLLNPAFLLGTFALGEPQSLGNAMETIKKLLTEAWCDSPLPHILPIQARSESRNCFSTFTPITFISVSILKCFLLSLSLFYTSFVSSFTLLGLGVVIVLLLFLFLRQGFIYSKLPLNLLCTWGWSWTPGPPASTYWDVYLRTDGNYRYIK